MNQQDLRDGLVENSTITSVGVGEEFKSLLQCMISLNIQGMRDSKRTGIMLGLSLSTAYFFLTISSYLLCVLFACPGNVEVKNLLFGMISLHWFYQFFYSVPIMIRLQLNLQEKTLSGFKIIFFSMYSTVFVWFVHFKEVCAYKDFLVNGF